MPQQLDAFTVNMKSMDQKIEYPIVASAGDAGGRTFKIIFTQEAQAQFTPETKVYLSWHHKQLDISGLNIFTRISNDPMVWTIKWPQAMLHKGDVIAVVKLVDNISITTSRNFLVHVMEDPDDGSQFIVSDDYTLFQQAVIDLNIVQDKAEKQLEQQKKDFENMQADVTKVTEVYDEVKENTDKALEKAQEAYDAVVNGVISKEDVQKMIDIAGYLTLQKVNELPQEPRENIIYLLPIGTPKEENQYYEEYIYLDGRFEKIGDTGVDLTHYITDETLQKTKEEIIEQAKQLDADYKQELQNYVDGYSDKTLDAAKEYTDSKLTESNSNITYQLDKKVDKEKIGEIPNTETVQQYVDRKVNVGQEFEDWL